MNGIIMTADSVCGVLDGRKTRKRIYLAKGEDTLSPSHLFERLMNGISINNETGCWEWARARNGFGYGTLTVMGKTKLAHRLSYELYKGPIPCGLHILHDCDNPSCINPEHLHAGTRSDNMRECYMRGRSSVKPVHLFGDRNGQAKLTQEDVLNIRDLLATGKKQAEIALMYGVSQSEISYIKRGVRWARNR